MSTSKVPVKLTHHGSNSEDMAVVAAGGVVLGDVREVGEVIRVLTRAVDVPDLVLTDQLLGKIRVHLI